MTAARMSVTSSPQEKRFRAGVQSVIANLAVEQLFKMVNELEHISID